MIQPVDMRSTLPMTLHGGASSTTTEVWEMLPASREGDLDGMTQLIARRPELSTCQFDYTPPLHFAVREGHLPLVRLLVEQKAPATSRKLASFSIMAPTSMPSMTNTGQRPSEWPRDGGSGRWSRCSSSEAPIRIEPKPRGARRWPGR